MALSPDFLIGQVTGIPQSILIEDTSTGSDVTIVARHIFLTQDNGDTLVPSGTTTNYILWPLVDTSFTIENILDMDYSLTVTVNWVDVLGATVETKSEDSNFKMYNSLFNYSLVSDEANGLASLNSINWLTSRMKLYLALNDSDTSVTDMSSITNGQDANDRGTYLRENKNLFY